MSYAVATEMRGSCAQGHLRVKELVSGQTKWVRMEENVLRWNTLLQHFPDAEELIRVPSTQRDDDDDDIIDTTEMAAPVEVHGDVVLSGDILTYSSEQHERYEYVVIRGIKEQPGSRSPGQRSSGYEPITYRGTTGAASMSPRTVVALRYLYPSLRSTFMECGVTDLLLADVPTANLLHEYMMNLNLMDKILNKRDNDGGRADDSDDEHKKLVTNLKRFALTLNERISGGVLAGRSHGINLFLQVKYLHPVLQDILTKAAVDDRRLVEDEEKIVKFFNTQDVPRLISESDRQAAASGVVQQPAGVAKSSQPLIRAVSLGDDDPPVYGATTQKTKMAGNTYDRVPPVVRDFDPSIRYDDEDVGTSCLNCFSGRPLGASVRSGFRRSSNWIRDSFRRSSAPANPRFRDSRHPKLPGEDVPIGRYQYGKPHFTNTHQNTDYKTDMTGSTSSLDNPSYQPSEAEAKFDATTEADKSKSHPTPPPRAKRLSGGDRVQASTPPAMAVEKVGFSRQEARSLRTRAPPKVPSTPLPVHL